MTFGKPAHENVAGAQRVHLHFDVEFYGRHLTVFTCMEACKTLAG